jgi:EmrB/QacA subfamily drug resistance transporter
LYVTVSRKRLAFIIVGMMLGMSLGALDQMIVGSAMPRVIAELNGLQHYAWVFAAYMLASTVVIPIYGKLSDIFGRRPFFLLGMSLFLIGSALSGASQNMVQLILFRALQGLGAGATLPMVQAIIGDLFPPIERGKWQGLIMSVWGLASIIGPALGGLITDHWGWRWVFYVNLPVGTLAMLTAGIALPKIATQKQRPVDYPGAALLVLASVPLLLAFSWGGTEFEWLSFPIIGMLAFSIAMFVSLYRVEMRAEEPIINPKLFRNHIFTTSVIAAFLLSAGMFSALVYIPLFVQAVMGESATRSGTVMAWHFIAFLVSNIAGGQILSRTGRYKILALIGFVVAVAGMVLLALMDLQVPESTVIRNGVIMGLGIGALSPLFTIVVQNAFPFGELGQVTANLQFFRSIGSTTGTAIFGTLLATSFHTHIQSNLPLELSQSLPAERLALVQNPQSLLSPATTAKLQQAFGPEGQALFDRFMTITRTSMAGAISFVFTISACSMVLGLLAAFFLKEIPLRKR